MRVKTCLTLLGTAVCCLSVVNAVPTLEKNAEELSQFGLSSQAPSTTAIKVKRHGDHDHEDEDEEPELHTSHEHSHESSISSVAASSDPAINNSSHAQHKSSGHEHYHGKAYEEYNETLVLMTHDPDPLSYWRFDQDAEQNHRGILVAHIIAMSLSFFVLLPLSIFLRLGKSAFKLLPQLGFLALAIIGSLLGRAYNAMTPSLYEGSSHSRLGWFVIVFAIGLNAIDLIRVFTLFATRRLTNDKSSQSMSTLLGHLSASPRSSNEDEGRPLVFEAEQYEVSSPAEIAETSEGHHWRNVSLGAEQSRVRPSRNSSQTSSDAEGTLYDSAGPDEKHLAHDTLHNAAGQGRWSKAINITYRVAEVILVVMAYAEVLSGIAIYSGSCRGAYINGCMAHTIKGSVFVLYGLLTWCRYLGAFADLGWAWNKRPGGSRGVWTAEFVECAVCTFYGATNTWLERLGKHAGDPYSAKDVQHISIAVMFWFAGMLGMMLESKKFRSWLQAPVYAVSNVDRSRITQPASASFSFNPFPSIIIGTTGIAMSAHAQLFKFQVDVHALWGLFLGLFGLFRCLTYFFLFLRPPASILPSRPPTEALASMFLTCGGVVFILSTEQVTLAAMRHHFDDIMMFLNGTVSLVSIAFCWLLVLFAIKGWALNRAAGVALPAKLEA